jgi:ATP-dependent Clp protease ATP-binding subunit ClpA
MFERFTRSAREAVVGARGQARELGHRHVGTEHLLLALLQPGATPASRILHDFGLTADGVRADITRLLGESRLITDADVAALDAIGIDVRVIRARLEELLGPAALEPAVPPTRYGLFRRKVSAGPFTPRSKKVLELSLREALRLKHNWIGTEHILLGLLREGQGLAAQILAEARIDLTALRRATEDSLRQVA